MKTIKDLSIQKGTRVLLRADFNVTVDSGKVHDDFRIKAVLPTINYLIEREAKIIIIAHLGRPVGQDPSLSLRPVANKLHEDLGRPVTFFKSLQEAKKGSEKMKDGEVALVENIRFDSREKTGDKRFAAQIAELGDVFVNDAFGVAHRKHTSVYVVPEFLPSAAGFLIEKEIEVLKHIREARKRPLVFVMGGAKVETKLKTLIEMYDRIDGVCVGGLLANTILKAKGIGIGKSWHTENIEEHLEELDLTDTKLHLPLDVVVASEPTGNVSSRLTAVGGVKDDEMILDAGPDTIKLFSDVIKEAGTVVWNGPLGLLEVEEFAKGTYDLARSLKESSAYVVVGGGDVMNAIDDIDATEYVDYTSTGGGAMLEYLAEGTLPAIEVLK
ncbi:MAG: phosphoglycerate kinase [Candidatus Spechtbacterales bacterium]